MKNMELFNGRPQDTTGRLPREVRTYDFLDSLGIEYKRTDHGHADTMEACNEIDAVLGVLICKNLFLCNRQKTAFYLLMMPGDKKFKTKELSAQINSARLSFAEPEDMLKYLDIEPGAVSIMGLMNDKDHVVQLLIDEDVLKDEYLGCHPCVNTSSLKLRTEDVIRKYLPAVGHELKTVHLVGEEPPQPLTHEQKNHELYLKQKALLEQFLSIGAISQAQYEKSLHDLTEKMGE